MNVLYLVSTYEIGTNYMWACSNYLHFLDRVVSTFTAKVSERAKSYTFRNFDGMSVLKQEIKRSINVSICLHFNLACLKLYKF